MANREHINIIVLLDCDLQCIRQTAPQETPTETGVLWNKKRSYPQLDREFPISCRTQQVIIEGRLSTTEDVHVLSGVIQGTLLGPFLYSFFINDRHAWLYKIWHRLFADDPLLYRPIKSRQDTTKLQKDLHVSVKNTERKVMEKVDNNDELVFDRIEAMWKTGHRKFPKCERRLTVNNMKNGNAEQVVKEDTPNSGKIFTKEEKEHLAINDMRRN